AREPGAPTRDDVCDATVHPPNGLAAAGKSYLNGAADFSQMIPERQRRGLLALSKVRIKPNLVAQGNASTHALGLTRFSVADRLCEREDIDCDGQWNEKHPIVVGQDQILPVHRPTSHGRTLQRAVRT